MGTATCCAVLPTQDKQSPHTHTADARPQLMLKRPIAAAMAPDRLHPPMGQREE